MTLPQEHFDLIERAAVSKPPQRIVNPRFAQGVIGLSRPLNSSIVARDGASTMTSFLDGDLQGPVKVCSTRGLPIESYVSSRVIRTRSR